LIKGVECVDGRLHYELVEGSGPDKGWVTQSLRGKELLLKMEAHGEVKGETTEASTSDDNQAAHADSGSGSETTTEQIVVDKASEEQLTRDEQEALRQYEEKFGQARDGEHPGYNRKAFPWFTNKPAVKETPNEAIEAAKAFKEKPKDKRKPRLYDVDSEGEEVTLCSRCFMPIGEIAYQGRDKNACVHAECMAQVVIEEMKEGDEKLQAEEHEKKMKNRKEYDIGWRMESVPKSSTLAERLGCSPAPQGLCCLVYDEAARTVRVAATLEPSAAVNLEYLTLALKVRKQGHREPLFSLDPVDPQNMEKTPQKKRYEPDWLAGTSVGDVMFQADYFLKELALGEYTLPVVGMLSVFDWSETLEASRQWAGREWFVVRKAEVRLAEDKTLIPFVKMGVEAREQVLGPKGLQDAPVTGANHPLKRFAEAFTRNFDLIAERKSVIYHLRELAKASVMAKFLVDSGATLDKAWFDLADELVAATEPEAHPEIPQLWNMRGLSRIQLKEGKLVDTETGLNTNLHAIYGGVEFGLDRFELAQRQGLRPGQIMPSGSALQTPGLQGMSLGPSGRPMFMPQRFQLSQGREMPQGVDLNLDKFDLAETEKFAGMLPACSGSSDSLEGRTLLGRAFLRCFQEGYEVLKEEDKTLLRGVFNPALSDRMNEAEAFTPPDPTMSYISKLRSLVNEEQSLLQRRKNKFFERSFVVGDAGAEFPRSWTSRFQIDQPRATQNVMQSGLVQIQVDQSFQQSLLKEILPTAAAEFEQKTEDGVVFRIYRLGSLEVRTVQEHEKAEHVGVVFSARAPSFNLRPGKKMVSDDERVTKASIYVEAIDAESSILLDQKWSSKRLDYIHYYVVLETDASNTILTEMLPNGTAILAMNPEGLLDRNSLAKLLKAVEPELEVTAGQVKQVHEKHSRKAEAAVSPSMRKFFAKSVFALTCKATGVQKARKYMGRAYPHPGTRTEFPRRPYTTRKSRITQEPVTKQEES